MIDWIINTDTYELTLYMSIILYITSFSAMLIHEFGHAIAIKRYGYPVEYCFMGGGSSNIIKIKIKDTMYVINPFRLGGFTYSSHMLSNMSPEDAVVIAKSGPYLNLYTSLLFLCILPLYLFLFSPNPMITIVLIMAALMNFLYFAFNIIPKEINGRYSDGWIIKEGKIPYSQKQLDNIINGMIKNIKKDNQN